MQYCNVKMPIDMAYQMTGKDVDCLLGALVVCEQFHRVSHASPS